MNKFFLVANPNTGKTTLFNTLTCSNEHVGNWHGVTVSCKSKDFFYNGTKWTVVDTPGLNSMNATSFEENDTIKSITKNKDNIMVCICDIGNLTKNLFLALELIESGYRVVVALNMGNEVWCNHEQVAKILSSKLSVPVVNIDARKKNKNEDLLKIIEKGDVFSQKCEKISSNDKHILIKKIVDALNIKQKQTNKLDTILLNRWLGIPCFMLIMSCVFFITFGPIGGFLSKLMEIVVCDGLFAWLSKAIFQVSSSKWLFDMFNMVLINGIGSVLCFLPQVVLLFLFLSLLEDVGYLSRVAFLFDAPLKKVGLSGRSMFSLLAGFGCMTSAVLITKNLETHSLRRKTALTLPFVSCSAKIPLLAVISSAFFSKNSFIIVLMVYLISIIVSLVILALYQYFSKQKKVPFIMEMPKLRFPTIQRIIGNSAENIVSFVKRTLSIVALFSFMLWFCVSFDFKMNYVVGSTKKPIIELVANVILPLFRPLGFESWGVVVALLFGLVAKEMIVASIAISNNVSGNMLSQSLLDASSIVTFSIQSALSFLLFVMISTPCIAALYMLKKELGSKYMWFCAVFQLVVAYAVSLILFQSLESLVVRNVFIVSFLIALMAFVVIKCMHKSKCNGCDLCKEKKWLKLNVKYKKQK